MLQWQTNRLFGISSSLCDFFLMAVWRCCRRFQHGPESKLQVLQQEKFLTSLLEVLAKRKFNCFDQYCTLLLKDFISLYEVFSNEANTTKQSDLKKKQKTLRNIIFPRSIKNQYPQIQKEINVFLVLYNEKYLAKIPCHSL